MNNYLFQSFLEFTCERANYNLGQILRRLKCTISITELLTAKLLLSLIIQVTHLFTSDLGEELWTGRADERHGLSELVDVVSAGKQWFARQ